MNYYPHQKTDFTPGTKISRLPAVYALATADMAFIKIGKTMSIKPVSYTHLTLPTILLV